MKTDEYQKTIDDLEKGLAIAKEAKDKLESLNKPEPEFKAGDVVEVQDYDGDTWIVGFYSGGVEGNFVHRIHSGSRWKHCRHAKDVPNVRIKHDGGAMPVDSNAMVTVWYRSGAVVKGGADCPSRIWESVTHYMIHPED